MTLQELNQRSRMFDESDDFTIEELVSHINEVEEFIVNNPGYAYVSYTDEHFNVYSLICKETDVSKYLKNVNEGTIVLVHRNGKCYDAPLNEIRKLVK